MDYESAYERMLQSLRMFKGRVSFDRDAADKTKDDNVRLPDMAPMYWDMAFPDKYFHITNFDDFVDRFKKEAMEMNRPFLSTAFLQYGIDANDPASEYMLERSFAARARQAFPSFVRDHTMLARLGNRKYGKNRVLYDSVLDMACKIDAVLIFENGGVCGLGMYLNTSEGIKSYKKHLERMAEKGRGHGNLPVYEVVVGYECFFNGVSFPCNKEEFARTELWMPTEAFVDHVMKEVVKSPLPKLEDLKADGVIGPKDEIMRVNKAQETRWPNVLLKGLRALTS
jgi:hypothetical protein